MVFRNKVEIDQWISESSLSIQDKIRSSVRGMTHCFRVRRLLVATSLDIIDKMPIIIMRVCRGMIIYINERTGVYA